MSHHSPIAVSVYLKLSDMVPVFITIGFRRFRWGMVLGGFILLGVGIQLYWIEASRSPGAAGDGIDLLQNLLPLVLLFSAFPVFLVAASYLTARSCLKNNPNLRGGIEYSFSEEGIRHQGAHSQGSLGWGGLNRVVETRGAFVLFHDKYTL